MTWFRSLVVALLTGHAFGLRPTADPVTTQWPGQVMQWLRDHGVL